MYRRELLGVAAGSVAGALGVGVANASEGGHGEVGQAGTTESTEPTDGAPDFAPLATLPVEDAREAVVGPDGTTVFLAVEDGFAVVDVADATAPRLLAERRGLLPGATGGPMAEVQDVAVDGDRLLVMGPAHAGTEGPRGALLYDVSDPAEPSQVAVHRTGYPIHNGTLDGGLAYLTANDGRTNPLEVVAMEPGGAATGDAGGSGGADGAGDTRVVGRWSIVDADPAWADVPAGIRPIHDVIVHRGVAYCSYWDAGTWLVDVGDPAEPRALGHVGERSPGELSTVGEPRREGTELPGNHHSASIDESGSLLAVGHEAWDADGDGEGAPGGIDLVDVSSPAAPAVLATIEPPPTDDPSRDGVWTTAHNFELVDGYLYSAWYQGGVRVHDVSDPRAPREVAAWRDSATTRFWTAQVASGAEAVGEAGAGRGAVVASSATLDGGDAVDSGLYTFPLPAPVTTQSPSRRQVTATPGMDGFGAAGALAAAGLAALLSARRRGE